MAARASHDFVTGFFDPEARAAGETVPDAVTVVAENLAQDQSFHGKLNEHLHMGRFDLPPNLTRAIDALREKHNIDGEHECETWFRVCERGALLFLRGVLLQAGKLPHYEWPTDATPRSCQRFGEAFASFCHYDMRLHGLRLWNIWIPVRTVASEPLLFFSADPSAAEGWREPIHKARHLLPSDAHAGSWYFWDDMQPGQALVFPGDGGASGSERALFHASAWVTLNERQSFDVRELVVDEDEGDDAADGAARTVHRSLDELREAARLRHERDVAAWDKGVEAMLEKESY